MIDKSQLRYGNLVVLAHESNAPIVEVFELENDTATVFSNEKGYNVVTYESLLPIDLSEYWLERLGDACEDGNEGNWQYRIRVGALNWYFRWNNEWYSEFGGIYLDSKFRHLHQVQNLYSDLLGKEINIKQDAKSL